MEIGNETTTRFSTPPPSSASTKIRLRMIHGTLARVRNGLGKIGAVPRKQHIALWHGNVGSENGGEGRYIKILFSKKKPEVPHFSRNPCVCSQWLLNFDLRVDWCITDGSLKTRTKPWKLLSLRLPCERWIVAFDWFRWMVWNSVGHSMVIFPLKPLGFWESKASNPTTISSSWDEPFNAGFSIRTSPTVWDTPGDCRVSVGMRMSKPICTHFWRLDPPSWWVNIPLLKDSKRF